MGAALFMAAWPWLFDHRGAADEPVHRVADGLRGRWSPTSARLLAVGLGAGVSLNVTGVGQFLHIAIAVTASLLFLGLLLVKLVFSISTVLVFVGMPLAAVLWPMVPWVARVAMRAFAVCLLVPVAWGLCFAATAAAGWTRSASTGEHARPVAPATGGDHAVVHDGGAADALAHVAMLGGAPSAVGSSRALSATPPGRRSATPPGSICRAGPAARERRPPAGGKPRRQQAAQRGDARRRCRQRRDGSRGRGSDRWRRPGRNRGWRRRHGGSNRRPSRRGYRKQRTGVLAAACQGGKSAGNARHSTPYRTR